MATFNGVAPTALNTVEYNISADDPSPLSLSARPSLPSPPPWSVERHRAQILTSPRRSRAADADVRKSRGTPRFGRALSLARRAKIDSFNVSVLASEASETRRDERRNARQYLYEIQIRWK